jgi:glutathione peroxidase
MISFLTKDAANAASGFAADRRRGAGLGKIRRFAIAAMTTSALVFAAGSLAAESPTVPGAADAAGSDCPPLLRYTFNSLQTGKPQSLCAYRGKVLVIVNTASYCAYTKQYEGLEALYRKYKDRGLVVIGFPSNDFGSQEPGSNKEIAEFCRTTYGVEFPMFEKSSVARLETQPLYAKLVKATGEAPQWNFHKYVVDRSGARIVSYASAVAPDERAFVATIERLLAQKPESGL